MSFWIRWPARAPATPRSASRARSSFTPRSSATTATIRWAQLGGVAPGVRRRVEHPDQGARVGPAHGLLEQSTRYVPYTARPGGQWNDLVPRELDAAAPGLRAPVHPRARRSLRDLPPPLDRADAAHVRARSPEHGPGDAEPSTRLPSARRRSTRLRGLLPAATQSNLGIYGTGQAYEALLLRMQAHPLVEVREFAALMLAELRQVIPAFLTRVDQPDRGGRWSPVPRRLPRGDRPRGPSPPGRRRRRAAPPK